MGRSDSPARKSWHGGHVTKTPAKIVWLGQKTRKCQSFLIEQMPDGHRGVTL
jgi:hypothetical protein